jgi:hypothetical protein
MNEKNRAMAHLTDVELLAVADGELSPADAARAQQHLMACWSCRSRQREMEGAISNFVRSRNALKDGLRKSSRRVQWMAAVVGLSVALIVGFLAFQIWTDRPNSRAAALAVPNPTLTPGAAVFSSRGELCRESNVRNKSVPQNLEKKVFEEYGIAHASARAYEVDYLITPALGGADDIHNLWPQPYSNTVWNAKVKDSLEDHLRQMVCDGSLELATAQKEIAGNWIEAYKKYFGTDQPLK